MSTEASFLGTGWTFPPSFSNSHYQLLLSAGQDNIRQSINLIFKTTLGSRPLASGFGSNLSTYLFRRIDTGLREEIMQNLSLALLNSEPRINVEQIDANLSSDGSTLLINVSYRIPETNTRHNHVYPFSLIEATNL
jgi:hypothetical protein